MTEARPATDRPLVLVSNRGPFAFSVDDSGDLVAKRSAGGLAATAAALVQGTDVTWIASAISEADRRAAAKGLTDVEGFRLHSLAADPADYRQFYDVVSNATLWFLHHRLFDLARRPWLDQRWREAWDAYRRVNASFADAVAADAPEGAVVLVQDYHLALVGRLLADRRPDLDAVHFTHTPFADPADLRLLPDDVATELLEGMAGYRACGFHSRRWADAFEACCAAVLGRTPATFVAPLGPDPDDIGGVAAGEACADALRTLDERLGDRRFVVRVDRIELSKNVLRGFQAFDELLRSRPEWREQVVFGAFVYPSRQSLPEYLAYRNEIEGAAARINRAWATPGWTPVILETADDFPRSVAALRRYDVLLVNPVRDGLNLVAKEGPLVNERDGVLALSREAGVFDELGDVALPLNPFDVAGTAEALHRALSMDGVDRSRHAAAVRAKAVARTPRDWLDDQLRAIA